MALLNLLGLKQETWTNIEPDLETLPSPLPRQILLSVEQMALWQDQFRDSEVELGLILKNDVEWQDVSVYLDKLSLISIEFPSFSDGRGFSLSMMLRQAGFQGRIRAHGKMIADQFAMAIDCGFDEVDVDPEILKRQPVQQWIDAATGITGQYQLEYHGLKEQRLSQHIWRQRVASLS